MGSSPIIRTKRRATALPLLFFFCKWDLNQTEHNLLHQTGAKGRLFLFYEKYFLLQAEIFFPPSAEQSIKIFPKAKAYQVPLSAPRKSRNPFGFWLFLYDDVELKPLQKGVPKNPKGIFGEEERQRSGFGVLF